MKKIKQQKLKSRNRGIDFKFDGDGSNFLSDNGEYGPIKGGDDSFTLNHSVLKTNREWIDSMDGMIIDKVRYKAIDNISTKLGRLYVPRLNREGGELLGIAPNTFIRYCEGIIEIPDTIIEIGENNFFEVDENGKRVRSYTISGRIGSCAHDYAIMNDIAFIPNNDLPYWNKGTVDKILVTDDTGQPYWIPRKGTLYLSETMRITVTGANFDFQKKYGDKWMSCGIIG